MSVPVFQRNPDGTAWEGRIAYKWSALRESNLKIDLKNGIMPAGEDIYRIYGVCPALRVNPALFASPQHLDSVYRFFYGYTLSELMEVKRVENTREDDWQSFNTEEYMHEKQKWFPLTVQLMNWDSFCLAFYTFLCSKNNFESYTWEVLNLILNELNASPELLQALLQRYGRPHTPTACAEFWATVYGGLQAKIRFWMNENTCYTAFKALMTIRYLFPTEQNQQFRREYIAELSSIAKARIDEACQEKYTVGELLNFNIETHFFYKEYFDCSAATRGTEQYVTNAVFNLMHNKGDAIAVAGDVLSADAVYVVALTYAQTEDEKVLVSTKRNRIAQAVFEAQKKQTAAELERQQKRELAERKAKTKEKYASAFAVLVAIGGIAAIVFGVLRIFGVFKPYSMVGLIISLCVTVFSFVAFAKVND